MLVLIGSEIWIPHLGKGIRTVGGNSGGQFAERAERGIITTIGFLKMMKWIVPTMSRVLAGLIEP